MNYSWKKEQENEKNTPKIALLIKLRSQVGKP